MSYAVGSLEGDIASGRAEDFILLHKTFAQRANVLCKRNKSTMLPPANGPWV
jgi:hypothetical protein